MTNKLVYFLIITILAISCESKDPDPAPAPPSALDCSTASATFSQANSIIQSSCANASSCHGSGSANGPGSLTTYSQVFTARNDMRAAILGGSMPKGSTLTSTQKATIICWIDSGAPNN